MKILVVAGEASADLHAGLLVKELKRQGPIELIGIGGDQLIQEGLKPLRTAREMAVVGLAEVVRRIPSTLALLNQLAELAAKEKPDLALLLDLPDFNLRLAPKLKRLGIPVIYYISPQVWVWRSKRVHQMAECIDRLLTILPFEKPWFEKNAPARLQVEYVGHPAIEEIPELPYEPDPEQICLMPGSREGEVRTLLGDLLGAAVLLKRANPRLRFVIPVAETLRQSPLFKELSSSSGPHAKALAELAANLVLLEKPAHEVLRQSKIALVASGTATLETGIVGVPMVVIYRVAALSAWIFRHLVAYQGPIALVNLVHVGLGSHERLVIELVQDALSPESLAAEAQKLLSDAQLWEQQKNRLAQTRGLLSGVSHPIKNAAAAIRRFKNLSSH